MHSLWSLPFLGSKYRGGNELTMITLKNTTNKIVTLTTANHNIHCWLIQKQNPAKGPGL